MYDYVLYVDNVESGMHIFYKKLFPNDRSGALTVGSWLNSFGLWWALWLNTLIVFVEIQNVGG